MLEQVRRLCEGLRAVDLGALPAADCALLVEELAVLEKACASLRSRAAVRAAACGVHRERGHHDAPAWLASATGASTGEAKAALEVAAASSACPPVRDAMASGDLSLAQAREILRAVSVSPGCEHDLVDLARRRGLRELKDAARKVRMAAVDPERLHETQRAAREFTHWRDELGMVCIRGRLVPEVGIPLVRRLEAATDRIRKDRGRGESRSAQMADAVEAVFANGGGGARSRARGRRAELVIVCDLRAWRRGHAHDGEPCHLVGGGPVPVRRARDLAEGAFVKAVLHDGVEIRTVQHIGRHIPAELRTALELGPPPAFEGAACVDCGRRDFLEFDHVVPFARGGPTALANMKPRCWPDHQAKTERDRAAGLIGPAPPRGEPP